MSLPPPPFHLVTRRPRTRRVFSAEDMERMYRLYYDRDVPLTKVAETFGVPVSTLLRWIAEMDWPRRGSVARAPAPAPPAAAGAAGPALDTDDVALAVGAAARQHLQAMGDMSGPMTPEAREREARVIASLARSIERVDRSFENRIRLAALESANAKLRAGLARPAGDTFDSMMDEVETLTLRRLKQALGDHAAPLPLADDGWGRKRGG